MAKGTRWAQALAFGVTACGGSDDADTVRFEDIPGDKKLVDLNPAEVNGVCAWAGGIARQKLPAPGTQLDCDGLQITFNGVTQCGATPPTCEATVSEWAACFPNFIDRIAVDPCIILDLVFPDDLEAFVEETPGCEGLGPCAIATR
jgi:hypothetical protein